MMTPWELNQSLRKNRDVILGQLARILDRAMAIGENAKETAKRIAQYANPWYLTRRGLDGQKVREAREGIQPTWPGGSGMVSAGPRRLMIQATQEAHMDAAVSVARENDGIGIRWDLAPGHPLRDTCDSYASRDDGLGPGVYLPEDVPIRPHTGCVCIMVMVRLRDSHGQPIYKGGRFAGRTSA